jgi:hypothetical protein
MTDREHVALTAQGVALVAGMAIALILVTITLIESAAERAYRKRDVILKFACSVLVIGAALAAPIISVPGSVLIGLVLAGIVPTRLPDATLLQMYSNSGGKTITTIAAHAAYTGR